MYKNAANKLKWGGTLASYEVLDFQHDPMHNNEPFEQLSEWINEHKPYIRALVKAAHLRQQHYETYIRGKLVEDPKHAHWRIGMNEIAADASAKLTFWTKQHNDLFENLIEINSFQDLHKNTHANVDFSIPNAEREEHATNQSGVISRPKWTKKEQTKRRNELKAIKRAKKAKQQDKRNQAAELDKFIDEANENYDRVHELYRQEFRDAGGHFISDLINEIIQFDSDDKQNNISLCSKFVKEPELLAMESPDHVNNFALLCYKKFHNNTQPNVLKFMERAFGYQNICMKYLLAMIDERDEFITTPNTNEMVMMILANTEHNKLTEIKSSVLSQIKTLDDATKKAVRSFFDNIYYIRRYTYRIYHRMKALEHGILRIKQNRPRAGFSDMYYTSSRLSNISRKEQMIHVDDTMLQRYKATRKRFCIIAGLDERLFITKDDQIPDPIDTGTHRLCYNPNCVNCL
jgi:hypothetical protein